MYQVQGTLLHKELSECEREEGKGEGRERRRTAVLVAFSEGVSNVAEQFWSLQLAAACVSRPMWVDVAGSPFFI